MSESTTAGVILAAGASRRFGRPKQLAEYAGQPLLTRACETALAADLTPLVVVLGANAARVQSAVDGLPVHCVRNPEWASGMASSLRCGILRVQQLAECRAVAVLLADQPFIDAAHLRQLCAARVRDQVDIAATRHGDTLGAPAVFHQSLFDQLCALHGDRGAGALIRASTSRIALTCEDAALDVDRPEDLVAAHRRRS